MYRINIGHLHHTTVSLAASVIKHFTVRVTSSFLVKTVYSLFDLVRIYM